jgi:hypothetical protein
LFFYSFERMLNIDWDCIEIEKIWKEEGPQHVVCEKGVYEKIGFKQEDEKERKAKEEVVDTGARAS